jgi:drug/metabolite transporter (DMT)-like permease
VILLDSDFKSYKFEEVDEIPFWKRLVLGDLLSLFCALCYAVNGLTLSLTRPEIPSFINVFYTSFYSMVTHIVYAVVVNGASLGFNPSHGVLGFLHP